MEFSREILLHNFLLSCNNGDEIEYWMLAEELGMPFSPCEVCGCEDADLSGVMLCCGKVLHLGCLSERDKCIICKQETGNPGTTMHTDLFKFLVLKNIAPENILKRISFNLDLFVFKCEYQERNLVTKDLENFYCMLHVVERIGKGRDIKKITFFEQRREKSENNEWTGIYNIIAKKQ